MDRLIHNTGYEDVKVSLQQIPEWIETNKDETQGRDTGNEQKLRA